MRIRIIGAGPAGCYVAKLLAEQGHKVAVYEEHEKIGLPVQCTGILSHEIEKVFKIPKKIISLRIKKTQVHLPKQAVELPLKGDYVINRQKFDLWLANEARKAGAKIHTGIRFIEIKEDNTMLLKKIRANKTLKANADILIGADGPTSSVAKAANIYGKRKFLTAVQAVLKLKNEGIVEFYPAIGTYAWVVPESKKRVRIGLAANSAAKTKFNQFVKERIGANWKKKSISMQGGIIPLYAPNTKTSVKLKPYSKKGKELKVFLVGDAALQIKNTTGGGIVPGLKAARALARAILTKKSYEKEWRKELANDLWASYLLRNMLSKFSEKDWNDLGIMISKPAIKKIFKENSRDNAGKLLLKIVLEEPALLKFALKNFIKLKF